MTAPQRLPEASRLRATQWPMILGLTLVWVLLWGRFSVGNVLSGVLVGVLVVFLFPLPPIEKQARLRPLGTLRFAGRFVTDMLASSWRLSWNILSPGPPSCAILGVRMRCPGDLMLAVTAVAVSGVPGSTVLELDRRAGTLYLHVVGAGSQDERDRARREVLRLEARVVRAFGTPADVAAIDASETAEEVFGRWR